MNDGPNGATRFLDNLKAEVDAFQGFCDILQTEQESLTQGHIDNLIALAKLKSEKVLLLTQLATERNRYLQSQSLPPNQKGMEMLAHSDRSTFASDDIVKIWHQLIEFAQTAEQLNLSNGIMIETKLQHNQQALAILQAAANQASLYGPDGKTQASGIGRPLGKV